jgi:hypothetical protein
VRAVDAAGNTDETPATRSFRVDTAFADTIITIGPNGDTKDASPGFAFGSPEGGVHFECRLDGPGPASGVFQACTSPKSFDALADGAYTLSVRALDQAGNVDPIPAERTFTVDTKPPDSPAIVAPLNDSVQRNSTISISGTAEGTATVLVDEGGTLRGTVKASASGNWSLDITAVADGAHTFSVRARDAAGNVSGARDLRVSVDRSEPETTLSSGPSGLTNNASPSFDFSSSKAGSTFECRLDGPDASTGTYAACTAPTAFIALTDGDYTFRVRATDGAGNVDSTPVLRSFIVDTTAADTSITGGPTGLTSNSSPSFTFASPEGGVGFECRLDGPGGATATFVACESPKVYAALSDGAYTLQVRTVDAAGNKDATPAVRTFSVDATAADTTITSGPTGLTTSGSPSFAFSSPEAGVQFECRLDGPGAATDSYANCASPKAFSGLADGGYTFRVRAVDDSGNPDPTPATRSFTVDLIPAETTITSGPAGPTNVPSPVFAFAAEFGATFQCRLDGPRGAVGSYDACTSPKTLASLADGGYTLSVRAVDAAGNVETTPAARSFTLDTVAPDTTIDSGPNGSITERSAAFVFGGSESGMRLECSLVGPGRASAFANCTSPNSYSLLVDGDYTFQVRGTDTAGNVDPTPASRSFTVAPGGWAAPDDRDPVTVPSATPAPIVTPSPKPNTTIAATPTFRQTVVARTVTGKVLMRRPGAKTAIAITAAQAIPLGSIVDAKAGDVELTALEKAGGATYSATVRGGAFTVLQPKSVTELRLNEVLARCDGSKTSAKKPRSRRLWASGSGEFQIRGLFSTAFSRFGTWLVEDTCASTTTRVTKGNVEVTQRGVKQRKKLRAGAKYVARAKG